MGSLKEIQLEEHDICSIVSNLLDNAIEGCSSVDSQNKRIQILIKSLGDVVHINVMNTYVDAKENHSRTDQNVHGYGLKSVKSKVEKYHGNVRWEQKDNWFIVAIMILNEEET